MKISLKKINPGRADSRMFKYDIIKNCSARKE
jgi:hypothetical protein